MLIRLTLLLFLMSSPALGQHKYFDWDTLWAERGSWEVGRNRESAACIATDTDEDGTLSWYGILPEGTWILAFSEPEWTLEPGSQLKGNFTFDNQRTLEAMGSTFNDGDRSGVVFEELPAAIAEEFEHSLKLDFSFGEGISGHFGLVGTAAAGLALRDCIVLDW